jgi:hypothetical protein
VCAFVGQSYASSAVSSEQAVATRTTTQAEARNHLDPHASPQRIMVPSRITPARSSVGHIGSSPFVLPLTIDRHPM